VKVRRTKSCRPVFWSTQICVVVTAGAICNWPATNGRYGMRYAIVEKCSKPAVRYIFIGGFSYQPSVLFLVAVFLKKPPLEIVFLDAVLYETR
jgi:hypothetical protein